MTLHFYHIRHVRHIYDGCLHFREFTENKPPSIHPLPTSQPCYSGPIAPATGKAKAGRPQVQVQPGSSQGTSSLETVMSQWQNVCLAWEKPRMTLQCASYFYFNLT